MPSVPNTPSWLKEAERGVLKNPLGVRVKGMPLYRTVHVFLSPS